MKTISDSTLSYLVARLLGRLQTAAGDLQAALQAHAGSRDNPHTVSLTQVAAQAGCTPADLFYPVGSVYISTQDHSPAQLFGGVWERIEDVFLLGCGKAEAGSTGGEEQHKLTTAEMPRHTHLLSIGYHISSDPMFDRSRAAVQFASTELTNQGSRDSSTNWETGGSQAHNNMPPYLAVYIWKRTA